MPAALPCPDQLRLQQFLLGCVDEQEAEQLDQHVAVCARCLEQLRNLRTDDNLERALRGEQTATVTSFDEMVAAALPTLKKLRPRYATRTLDPGEYPKPDSRFEQSAEFLDAPESADELGRLGPYRVLRVLGAGGMGMVFLAEDPRLKRRLALKVIQTSLVARDDVRQRFLREAQAIAAIEHENIVTVYEVNEHRGIPYLAMPLLRGESLQDRLDRTAGPLPVDEILHIGRETAAGLAAAHDRGLVHRDIKPGNLWLESQKDDKETRRQGDKETRRRTAAEAETLPGGATSNPVTLSPCHPVTLSSAALPRVKILDFGLARALRSGDANAAGAEGGSPELTRLGAITGTPAYMAPEQAEGRPVDGRADLFSLGCVVYRMATGQMPFKGDDVITTLFKVVSEHPPLAQTLNPELPDTLSDLIVQLLAKQPDERPASAQAVVEAIRALEAERAEAGRPKVSRRRWLFISAACVLAAVGGTAGLFRVLNPPPLPEEPGTVTFDYDEPDQRLALRRGDEEERVINVAETPTLELPAGDYALRTLAMTGERRLEPERLLVKPGEKQSTVLRLVGEVRRHRFHANSPIRGIAAAAGKGGPLVIAIEDRSLSVWDPMQDEKPKAHSHNDSPLRCVAVTPGGRLFATGSGDIGPRAMQVIRLWDVDPLQQRKVEMRCGYQVNALAFSPDGKRLLSAENNGPLTLWDMHTGIVKWELPKPENGNAPFVLAYLPNGKGFLTGHFDGQIVLRAVEVDKPIRAFRGHKKRVRGLAVLASRDQAISGGDDATIWIWDLKTGQGRSLPSSAPIKALAVSPDEKRLLIGGDDGMIRLLDLNTEHELIHFATNGKAVTAAAFLPDGRHAVSGGSDGTVRLWKLPNL